MKIIGIDLAGCQTNPSGFAMLSGRAFYTQLIYSDKQIIDLCTQERPGIVSIDAPLSMPARGNLREADVSLIKRGLRVFPPTFAGMRSLTERGICLAKKLRARKIRVIEIHPRTSGVVLFKTANRKLWITKLRKMGFRFEGGGSRHEMDAALAALTGALHIRGKTEEIGDPKEGTIVIPSRQAVSRPLEILGDA
jgi:predicted nuclease with RNAse H fold